MGACAERQDNPNKPNKLPFSNKDHHSDSEESRKNPSKKHIRERPSSLTQKNETTEEKHKSPQLTTESFSSFLFIPKAQEKPEKSTPVDTKKNSLIEDDLKAVTPKHLTVQNQYESSAHAILPTPKKRKMRIKHCDSILIPDTSKELSLSHCSTLSIPADPEYSLKKLHLSTLKNLKIQQDAITIKPDQLSLQKKKIENLKLEKASSYQLISSIKSFSESRPSSPEPDSSTIFYSSSKLSRIKLRKIIKISEIPSFDCSVREALKRRFSSHTIELRIPGKIRSFENKEMTTDLILGEIGYNKQQDNFEYFKNERKISDLGSPLSPLSPEGLTERLSTEESIQTPKDYPEVKRSLYRKATDYRNYKIPEVKLSLEAVSEEDSQNPAKISDLKEDGFGSQVSLKKTRIFRRHLTLK